MIVGIVLSSFLDKLISETIPDLNKTKMEIKGKTTVSKNAKITKELVKSGR